MNSFIHSHFKIALNLCKYVRFTMRASAYVVVKIQCETLYMENYSSVIFFFFHHSGDGKEKITKITNRVWKIREPERYEDLFFISDENDSHSLALNAMR